MRPRLDTGRLALYQVANPGRLGMFWPLMSVVLGHWKQNTAVSEWMAPELTIAGRGATAKIPS